MSFVLRTPNGDVDLGPSMEVLQSFGEIGKLEPGDELAGPRELPLLRQRHPQLLVIEPDDPPLECAEVFASELRGLANLAKLLGIEL